MAWDVGGGAEGEDVGEVFEAGEGEAFRGAAGGEDELGVGV